MNLRARGASHVNDRQMRSRQAPSAGEHSDTHELISESAASAIKSEQPPGTRRIPAGRVKGQRLRNLAE